MSCAVGNEVTVDDGTLYQCTRTSGALDPGQCSIGDVVTVQPGVEYRCDQTPFRLETVTCRRVLLVSCVTTGINCGNAGIKGGSISGRNLSYGWTASGLNVYTDIGKYERQTHDLYFELENFAQINEFVLTYMGGNVTAGIAVNGHWVVSGGSGISGFHFDPTADRLTLTQSGGLFGTKICWTATNCISNFPDPDGGYWSGAKELMPYMVDGANHIHIVTINGPRKGNYQINFRVKQKCTSICEDNWDNQCAPFEARS